MARQLRAAGALAALIYTFLSPSNSWAATVFVQQVGLTFVPNDITIQVGDTVTWVWNIQEHTVTSGTGAADPQAGALFDMPFFGSNVSYTFTTPGDVPYFCRPHEIFGMLGIVRVTAPQVPTARPGASVLLVALLIATGLAMLRFRAVRTNPRA